MAKLHTEIGGGTDETETETTTSTDTDRTGVFSRRAVLLGGGAFGAGLLGLGAVGLASESVAPTDPAGSNGGAGSDGKAAGGAVERTPQPTRTAQPTQSQYVYRQDGLVDDYYLEPNDNQFMGPTLFGTAVNISGGILGYVQIQVSYYDAAGYQLGTGIANTNNLAAGARWPYEVSAFDEFAAYDVEDWELEISAY